MALERNPEVAAAFVEHGHEIACHGWRWIAYQNVDEATEREHMPNRRRDACAERPAVRRSGWYTGRDSPNTRRLVVEHGGFLYDSDYYGDDLPFWTDVTTADGRPHPHLIVPYTLDTNDMRFATAQGFNSGEQFFAYLRDAFDVLYAEGEGAPEDAVDRPALPAGRPTRTVRRASTLSRSCRAPRPGLDRRRVDIARHWIERHPHTARGAPA